MRAPPKRPEIRRAECEDDAFQSGEFLARITDQRFESKKMATRLGHLDMGHTTGLGRVVYRAMVQTLCRPGVAQRNDLDPLMAEATE